MGQYRPLFMRAARFEFEVLFNRFFYSGFKVLGVVESANGLCLKRGSVGRFTTSVVRNVKSSTWSAHKGFIGLISLVICCVTAGENIGFSCRQNCTLWTMCFSWQNEALVYSSYTVLFTSLQIDTDFFNNLYNRVSECYFFQRCALFLCFKSVIKMSKAYEFKKF